jgi:hypothetical protein
MKKQQLTDLTKIEHYNIYECLELFRNLQGLEPTLSRSAKYKSCRYKVEARIMQLVAV